jgi:hypothetical protein
VSARPRSVGCWPLARRAGRASTATRSPGSWSRSIPALGRTVDCMEPAALVAAQVDALRLEAAATGHV